MALVRWNPIGTLAGMEIDRLNRMFSALEHEAFAQAWVPAVDIYETDNHDVVIKAELPDVKKEDIGVSVENNVLTLTGERKRMRPCAGSSTSAWNVASAASAAPSRCRRRSMPDRLPRPTRTAS